jgi:hypothetical protein
MNFYCDYIILTHGLANLVAYVADQTARQLYGMPGRSWSIRAEDDFVTLSFAQQRDMRAFITLWQALTGDAANGAAG